MKKILLIVLSLIEVLVLSGCASAIQQVSDQMRQSTYDTQQLINQQQQRNNQLYQQSQNRKTNYQLQQINNNLNAMRYGY